MMVRRSRVVWFLVAPVVLLALIVGCSGRGGGDDETADVPISQKRKKGGSGGVSDLKPVVAQGTTTIKGQVRLKAGATPDFQALTDTLRAEINKMEKDRSHCLRGGEDETTQFSWVVDASSRGVKNVFVWLRPENDDKQYFDVAELVKAKKGFRPKVILDQPHCAFKPHADVLFLQYIDPKSEDGLVPTGQEFVVKNSAPVAHNTSWSGDSTRGGNVGLSPNDGMKFDSTNIKNIEPSYKTGVALSCSIHPWMKAYVWNFPHPFAAVTDEKGNFTIENAPAGVPLRLVAWHESARWVNGGEKGTMVTLSAGEHKADIEFEYAAR